MGSSLSGWKVLTKEKLLNFLTLEILLLHSNWLMLLSSSHYLEEKAISHSISLGCLIRNELVGFIMIKKRAERKKTHGSCWGKGYHSRI